MDQLVSGLTAEKTDTLQQPGEPAKTSTHQQSAPLSETQSPAASSPQGFTLSYSHILIYV